MSKRIMPFREVPARSVFKVLKERGRTDTAKGWYVKISDARSQAYSKAQDVIFGLGDMVEVLAFPSELKTFTPK